MVIRARGVAVSAAPGRQSRSVFSYLAPDLSCYPLTLQVCSVLVSSPRDSASLVPVQVNYLRRYYRFQDPSMPTDTDSVLGHFHNDVAFRW